VNECKPLKMGSTIAQMRHDFIMVRRCRLTYQTQVETAWN